MAGYSTHDQILLSWIRCRYHFQRYAYFGEVLWHIGMHLRSERRQPWAPWISFKCNLIETRGDWKWWKVFSHSLISRGDDIKQHRNFKIQKRSFQWPEETYPSFHKVERSSARDHWHHKPSLGSDRILPFDDHAALLTALLQCLSHSSARLWA